MSFNHNFDFTAFKFALGENFELSYKKDLPEFLEKSYENILNYLKIESENVIPSVTIKIGGQKDTIFFKKPESPDSIGRIICNLGPDESFRMSKEIDKKRREYTDICIFRNGCQYLDSSQNDIDIIVMGNPMRILETRTLKRNFKNQPFIDIKKIKKYRPVDHYGMVMVIELLINMESKLAKDMVTRTSSMLSRIGEGDSENEEENEEEIKYNPDTPIVRL